MGDNANKPTTVAEAKQRLRATPVVEKPDYLGKIKERPIASVGIAFMAGMMLNKVSKGGLPAGLLNIGLQLMKNKL